MPTAERYSRYREDQTTIWVSKTAADTLSRERNAPGEGAAAVLDRLLNELRKLRRGSGGGAAGGGAAGGASGGAAKSAGKSAAKGATKSATRGAKTAKKGGAKTAKAARR